MTQQPTLQEWMATNPDGTLEEIASCYHTTLLAVAEALPAGQRTLADGRQFDFVWDSMTGWGCLTLIAHSQDAILEFKSELPQGSHRHGYFNLRGQDGLSGHIRADRCHRIALIERKFMGMDTASVVFFNPDGAAMFKVFLGRDEQRRLRAEQMTAFRALAQRLAGVSP
ncbi:heme utilization cystosolic carrier protein HutX [Affinibrenneria salicis]|uniref:Heme utilization cystosolic carrier protein HutX n=1 Tax=Affinibrenneria salicis TaxID=2590031 RepID=A0A5J5G3L3_9GAMM|nr:heme utilization cystosolic carrier protein HutX [Affinibrenneria salicis]KAA9000623.1 heme utilization cystosolic carrier protein HutX [Affinibrenneria salicis]